jgi:hypothetical protein
MAVSACALAACGSTAKYDNQPRQPLPVNLTVYIGASGISVSPSSVGAGPVEFYVTNQTMQAESLQVGPAGGQALASTGPINPQGATQVGVTFSAPGDYLLRTSSNGAALATALLRIGSKRPGSNSTLLTP